MNGPGCFLDDLNQSLALISSGNAEAALGLLTAIPAEAVLYPHALHLRGIAHATQARTAQAIESFEEALPWLADNEEFLANLARAYSAGNRFADALALLDKVVEIGRATAITFADRAVLLEKLERDALALESFNAALTLDAGLHTALAGKGNLLHKIEKYDEALACYERLIAMQPYNALARSSRASTLDKLGRMTEALTEHQHAQSLCPEQANIWSGHGVCLVLLERLEEGLDCFDRALAIDPTHAKAMINRASVLAELCRYPESLHQFEAALRDLPDESKARAQALRCQGMVRLALGDQAGWAGYEHRSFADQALDRRNAMAPRWSGTEPLIGKRVLLWGEQGYGDVIQFCRYAVSLAELGAEIILQIPEPLHGLCASLPANVIYGDDTFLPAHDFHIPMMSMPHAMQAQPQLAGIPCSEGYLHAEARFVEKWKEALPAFTRKQKIGIACSGALNHSRNGRRSIPLEKLLPLIEVADLFILQPDFMVDDLAFAEGRSDIIRPLLDIRDFADVAGLIANLDLVLSVDTSIAHLAGAMGVPVWILLPWNAEWRWMTARADTPWYDSARLFRQPARGEWDTVIRQVLHALPG